MEKRYLYYKKTSLLLVLLIVGFISFPVLAGNMGSVTCTVSGEITVCGNNEREGSEQCDGSDLAGETCITRGFVSGALSCYPVGTANECTFNTSACTTVAPPMGGGVLPPAVTKVIIQGKAYPEAEITLLSDGKITATEKADSLANFKFEITDITSGTWTFSLWAVDRDARRSITFSFTANVTRNRTTTISGILLPPTIELSKTKLQKGETLNIFGQTAPQSEVSILVEPLKLIEKTIANKEGDWEYFLNTSILDEGSYTVKAKAVSPEDLSSSYSEVLNFYIEKVVPEVLCPNADLNGDNKVDLVDFSILLYWWGTDDACCDQNNDGIVSLSDFSIMMYYWTG